MRVAKQFQEIARCYVSKIIALNLENKMFDLSFLKIELFKDINLNFGGSASDKEKEVNRRKMLLSKLHQEYILSHDGISPAMMAGLELPPKEWINTRLKELGETWII